MSDITDISLQEAQSLEERAQFVRLETIRLIEIAKVGHYSSVFSCAEIFSALYYDVMSISDDPKWPLRDRFLMGKGHAAVGLFPVLADLGYFPKDWLDSYTRLAAFRGSPRHAKGSGCGFQLGLNRACPVQRSRHCYGRANAGAEFRCLRYVG